MLSNPPMKNVPRGTTAFRAWVRTRRWLIGKAHSHSEATFDDRRRCSNNLEKLGRASAQVGSMRRFSARTWRAVHIAYPGPPADDSDCAQLEGTRRLAEETEAVGGTILCNLYAQREAIQRANQHAQSTNTNLQESKSLINKMSKWWHGLIG